jgi:transposase InsO family protein
MPKASKGGSKYLATFLDDYSKLSVVQPLKKKSDVAAVTKGVLARLELQTGKKVKAVQTDRGGEYVNEEMTTLLSKRGIAHRKTVRYSPDQNGSAERLNRDLQENGRAMLEDLGLGEELWAEAMVTANYTCNRLPSRVHGKTPWEKFFGEKSDVSHMRVFGAHAYMHIPKENRKKMQSVSERGVFVG